MILTDPQDAPLLPVPDAMAKSDMPVPRRWRGLTVHARGHLLLFDQRSAFHWDAETGARLLFIAVAIEAIRLVAIEWLHPVLPLLILVLLLLAGVLGLVRFAAQLKLSGIGLYPWSEWSPVEKSYFVQLLVIANIVFPLVFANRLRLILAQPSVVATVWSAFVPYLFFGFYQEVVYRGILQSEFVRRWGALAGILTPMCSIPLGRSIGITLRRTVRSRFRCSRRSSQSVCSLVSCSGGRAISGSSRSSMGSAMPTSSGASRRAELDRVTIKRVRWACR